MSEEEEEERDTESVFKSCIMVITYTFWHKDYQ